MRRIAVAVALALTLASVSACEARPGTVTKARPKGNTGCELTVRPDNSGDSKGRAEYKVTIADPFCQHHPVGSRFRPSPGPEGRGR